MSLDLSGAEMLAQDLLRVSDEYRAHDAGLANELSSKAHEICLELGIDPASFDQSEAIASSCETSSQPPKAQECVSPSHNDAVLENGTTDTLLDDILVHQRKIVEDPPMNVRRPTRTSERSDWFRWRIFGPLVRSQPT